MKNHIYSNMLLKLFTESHLLYTQIHHRVQFVLILISKWMKSQSRSNSKTKNAISFSTVNCDGYIPRHWWFWCEKRAVFIADTNTKCGFPLCVPHSFCGICERNANYMQWLGCLARLAFDQTLLQFFHLDTFCFENVRLVVIIASVLFTVGCCCCCCGSLRFHASRCFFSSAD